MKLRTAFVCLVVLLAGACALGPVCLNYLSLRRTGEVILGGNIILILALYLKDHAQKRVTKRAEFKKLLEVLRQSKETPLVTAPEVSKPACVETNKELFAPELFSPKMHPTFELPVIKSSFQMRAIFDALADEGIKELPFVLASHKDDLADKFPDIVVTGVSREKKRIGVRFEGDPRIFDWKDARSHAAQLHGQNNDTNSLTVAA